MKNFKSHTPQKPATPMGRTDYQGQRDSGIQGYKEVQDILRMGCDGNNSYLFVSGAALS